jgi:chemotaxis protein methyltransferase CheR
MTVLPDPVGVERFRTAIGRHLGLRFEENRLPMLTELLQRRLNATERDCNAYLWNLEEQPAQVELHFLAGELTVPESYFFRNIGQFHAVEEVALPECLAARGAQKGLRVLSAGCASGEEPYSLDILLREAGLDPTWEVSITAVDLNPAVLEKARRRRYSPWALRETPPEIRKRWFLPAGNEFLLVDGAGAFVRFEERNLAADDPDLWRPEFYDLVFCRNVIMYFLPETAQQVIARCAQSLQSGGFLFLGHAETLRGLSHSFHLRHTHGIFYYQRKTGDELARSQHVPAPVAAPEAPPLAVVMDEAEGWVDAIRRASERIAALTPASPRSASETGDGTPQRQELQNALALLRCERYADALDVVQALPQASAVDPDVLLLHAVLLTHSGRLALAEQACRRLLEADELSAGAHYLLALCREGTGDSQGAAEHDRVAVYVDPAFAMPHLHLGLLARRTGDRELARRELAEALTLLQREEASRLLLFGGGFRREALIALCRAELRSYGRER